MLLCCNAASHTHPPTHPAPAGDQFAIFESITALSMLVRRFDFAPAPDAPPVGMTTGATIHTTNGWVQCHGRAGRETGCMIWAERARRAVGRRGLPRMACSVAR